jgi:hypothetical protein
MTSPQSGSIAFKGGAGVIPRNPEIRRLDGWFIAREFFQNVNVGFAHILALLPRKTTGDSWCIAAGAIIPEHKFLNHEAHEVSLRGELLETFFAYSCAARNKKHDFTCAVHAEMQLRYTTLQSSALQLATLARLLHGKARKINYRWLRQAR